MFGYGKYVRQDLGQGLSKIKRRTAELSPQDKEFCKILKNYNEELKAAEKQKQTQKTASKENNMKMENVPKLPTA